MLTRSGVAKRLGKSIATVRRMEDAELHPVRDARGVYRFSEEEVEKVAHADSKSGFRPGRVALAPYTSGACELELADHALELAELRQRTAQLEQEREADQAWFAQEMRTAERRATEFAENRERALRAKWAQQSERQRFAATRATQRLSMRANVAEVFESLSPRQLARLDPVELEEILRFIYDED